MSLCPTSIGGSPTADVDMKKPRGGPRGFCQEIQLAADSGIRVAALGALPEGTPFLRLWA